MPRKKNKRVSANTKNKIMRPSEPPHETMTLQNIASATGPGVLAASLMATALKRREGRK